MLRWVIYVTLLGTLINCAEYTRRRRPSFQQPQFDMPLRLQRPNYRNPLNELAYDLPPSSSSSKHWASAEQQSGRHTFTDDPEDLDSKCTAFPNQTLFQPHFFSCDSIGEFNLQLIDA